MNQKIEAKVLNEKWAPITEHESLPEIRTDYRKYCTNVVMENTVREIMNEKQGFSTVQEALPANFSAGLGGTSSNTSGIDAYDPIMIQMVRRSLPNLMAFDIAGVQPMTGPTGLIFAMKSNYTDRSGAEALFNEANTAFSGTGTHQGSNPANGYAGSYGFVGSQGYLVGRPVATSVGEDFGGTTPWSEMAFTIEKSFVEAKTRGLLANYTIEFQQDLKQIHGMNATSELANILSQELVSEINREVVRTIYRVAKQGAQSTATPGTFDLDVDSNGRWMVERFKGLMFQIEREANVIGQETRRGRGNVLICTSDVAAALKMAGVLDYTPAIAGNNTLETDDTGNTFIGILNGRFKCYIDPYSANINAANQFAVVGYKGSNQYDAGLFYCPYVPFQMLTGQNQDTFQPKLAFKTRYGLVANPFVQTGGNPDASNFTIGANQYYRGFRIQNLM